MAFRATDVFKVNSDGTGFKTLHAFTEGSGQYPDIRNRDGANPSAGLTVSGDTLYGMTRHGGDLGYGTVFALRLDGTDFTTLYHFTGAKGGLGQSSRLVFRNNALYGLAGGGAFGKGMVFELTLPSPRLAIESSEENWILTWPTNAHGFTLQSTASLGSGISWSAVSQVAPPLVINDQYVLRISNTTAAKGQFYRLSR